MSEQTIEQRLAQVEDRVSRLESRADAVKKTLAESNLIHQQYVEVHRQTHYMIGGIIKLAHLLYDGDLMVWRFIVNSPVFPECEEKQRLRDQVSKSEMQSDAMSAMLRDLIKKSFLPPGGSAPGEQPGK